MSIKTPEGEESLPVRQQERTRQIIRIDLNTGRRTITDRKMGADLFEGFLDFKLRKGSANPTVRSNAVRRNKIIVKMFRTGKYNNEQSYRKEAVEQNLSAQKGSDYYTFAQEIKDDFEKYLMKGPKAYEQQYEEEEGEQEGEVTF